MGPLQMFVWIISSNESLWRINLLFLKAVNIGQSNPDVVKGWSATWITPKQIYLYFYLYFSISILQGKLIVWNSLSKLNVLHDLSLIVHHQN